MVVFLITGIMSAFLLVMALAFFLDPLAEPYWLVTVAAALGAIAAARSLQKRLRIRPAAVPDERHAARGLAVDLEGFSATHVVIRVHDDGFAEQAFHLTPDAFAEPVPDPAGLSIAIQQDLAGLTIIVMLAVIYYLWLR